MEIKKIAAQDTLPLRHRVLWPDESIEFCKVDEDDSGTHYGVFIDERLVCVASVFITNNVARLRKFATDPDFQGQGIGSMLLQTMMSELMSHRVEMFWCDARESACSLYQKFGMTRQGERFYKGDVPYFRMSITWQ